MLKITIRSFIIFFLLIGYTFVFTNSVKAEDKKFYVGIGGSYQVPDLDIDKAVDWDDNSWGINANFGYHLTPAVSLQVDIDYVPEIEGYYKPDNSVKQEVEVLTGIVSLKGYFPVSKPVKPFIIAGFGILHYNIDLSDEAKSLGYYLVDDDDTSLCFKIGGGLDCFINQNVSIGLEANYTASDDVQYYNFILGAAYHF
jgi:opacity protein-like surface antigen